MSKLPGKTAFSEIRRPPTRRSGFKSHADSTGGEFKRDSGISYILAVGEELSITFELPDNQNGFFFGFGGYFSCRPESFKITTNFPQEFKMSFCESSTGSLSKFGSMWRSDCGIKTVTFTFLSLHPDNVLSLYNLESGLIWHEIFDVAIQNKQQSYLEDMHSYMPEAGFYVVSGDTQVLTTAKETPVVNATIFTKSCNRCARFLPINMPPHERETLSFSNHCVSRAPCRHKGFGLLSDLDNQASNLSLNYGFQLECRFCKRYFVNMPLNYQRTSAQMKEDGQRRRNFELLIAEMYEKSPQLNYRIKTGRELVDDIWAKFNGECFKCEKPLDSIKNMNLDHTRPLALLWPLDGTATALCRTCNSAKRDRPPSEFYSPLKLARLAQITGLDITELVNPEPNHAVIAAIFEKLDWLYESFLIKPELLRERDGKVTSELVVKALDKVLMRSKSVKYGFSFVDEYNRRRNSNVQYDDSEDLSTVI